MPANFDDQLRESALSNDIQKVGTFQPTRSLPAPKPITIKKQVDKLTKAAAPATTADPTGKGGVPKKLLSCSATESPSKQQERTFSEVSVNFTRDGSDTSFGYVDIWFIGYKGNSNPSLMASTTDSPYSFLCETTGETVRVILQPIGVSGASADLSFAISTTVKLDGVVSAPPAPSIVQAVVATPFGYQFSFNQVNVGSTQDVIDSYRVYRNSTNTTSGAALRQIIKHDPTHAGAVVVQDNVNRGVDEYYWVTSVNTVGLESTKTAAQGGTNTGFTESLSQAQVVSAQITVPTQLVSGTTLTSGWTAGNNVFLPGDFVFDIIVTQPATDYLVDVLIWASDNASKPNGYIFRFDNRNGFNSGQILTCTTGAIATVGTAKGVTNAARLPPGAYHCICRVLDNGQMDMFVNGVWQWHYVDITYAPTGATYFTYESHAPAIAPYMPHNGQWGSGELLAQGGIAALAVNTFSYVATTTSIKWTWSAFNIYNPDGTTITVAANSTGTTFSSLSPSTTYFFGFYVPVNTAVAIAALSDTSSGTAACSNAQVWQLFNGDGNVGINYNIQASTPASGSGGGSGGGAGGGTCITGDTLLFDGTPIGEAKVGNLVLVEKDDGSNELRKIKKVLVHDFEGVLCDLGNGGGLITPRHHIRHEGKWVAAETLFVPEVSFKGKVFNLEVESDLQDEHNYVLKNGLCLHNFNKK